MAIPKGTSRIFLMELVHGTWPGWNPSWILHSVNGPCGYPERHLPDLSYGIGSWNLAWVEPIMDFTLLG